MKLTAALLATKDCSNIGKIFDAPGRKRIARSARLLPQVLHPGNFQRFRTEAARVNVVFGTWGLPVELLTPENFPNLKLVLYAAGTVKSFARPLLERGVKVVSARQANATPVAQFCLAQIILSAKGYFRNTRDCRDAARRHAHGRCYVGPGSYGETVALLGFGAIARELLPQVQACGLQVAAMDPYLTKKEAAQLNVRKVTMEQAFATGYVVSNHLPNLPDLQRVIDRKLLETLRPGATFINTGRGAQVNEKDLIAVARARPDLTFLLDVTEPEPPAKDSPLYKLPNVQLSAHIAGALNDEIRRLGDFVITELEQYKSRKPLRYAETLELFDRQA